MLFEQRKTVLPGIVTAIRWAAVDYNRQLRVLRKLQLSEENISLSVTRRVIVKIVEADLAPGNYFWLCCKQLEFVEIPIRRQLCFMWMNADGCVYEFIFLRELNSAVKRSRPRAAADGDNAINASFASPRNHLLTVRVELLHLEMCVRIYENQSKVLSHRLAWPRRDGCPRPSQAVFRCFISCGLFQPCPDWHILQ